VSRPPRNLELGAVVRGINDPGGEVRGTADDGAGWNVQVGLAGVGDHRLLGEERRGLRIEDQFVERPVARLAHGHARPSDRIRDFPDRLDARFPVPSRRWTTR
jgi:hypothetical protein